MFKRILITTIVLALVFTLGYAESGQANNGKTVISLSLTPDLIIETITWSPTEPLIEDTVTFTVTVKNQGTSQASNSRVAYFIDDAYVTSNYLNPIDPDATATKTFTWKAQVGSHTVKAVADYDNEVTESNETNNVKTYTFSTLAPDLIIESITWSPENPSKGDTVTFSVKIKNQGTSSASSCRVYFYIDGSSRGYQNVPRIDAGATATKTFTWVAQVGSHAIKAIVDKDDWILESDETNNEKTVNFSTFAPDLIIESITWLPETPEESDNVTFSVNITNQGDGRADYSQVAYYINDTLLASDFLDPIDPGATDNSSTFNWIAQEGTYAIKVVADYNDRVTESDETNNALTVTFSTLLPDLIIESITWLPEEPSIGDEITFSVKIKNQGDGRAGVSRVYFYIDDSSRGYQNIPELDVGERETKTFTWKAQEGPHTIKAIIDEENQILESNEGNNEKPVNFATLIPDLIIEGIISSPSHPSIADNVIFTVTVKNQGSGKASNSRVAYYIDNTLLTSDYLNPISPNATANETFTWTAQAGTHTIKAVADYYDWIAESDETNNALTVTLSTMVPDLIIESITGSPTEPSIEDEVTFTVTIKNQGSGKAGLSHVYFYVDASYRGYQDVTELDVGATVNKTFNWTAQEGTHAIKAVADSDNKVTENDETNNEKTVTLSILAPDLTIETITWLPEEPSIGDNVTFTVTVINQGTCSAGSSVVYFYIDAAYQSYQDVPELEASATVNTTFTWAAQEGLHAIKAVADKANDITESQEFNNEKTVTLSFSPSPALTPTPAPTPAPAPATKPTPTPIPTPQAGKSTPFPSLGKGIWLDLLFVLVLIILIGALIKGLMRPRQR